MARRFDHSFQPPGLPGRVGYSAKRRNGQVSVVFTGPDGKRAEKGTGLKRDDEAWHREAERLIRAVFAPLSPSAHLHPFEEALAEVERTSPHTRAETFRSFRGGVRALREVFPDVANMEDVSLERVARFGKLWLAAPGAAGTRSPVTLSYYQRALSAFYNHLIALGHLTVNPWKGAKVPKAPKKKKPAPKEEQVLQFFRWVKARYPGWEALHALLELNAVSGCRTFDLCQLKSDQLQAGRLYFDASQTKTNESRDLPLPGEVFDKLVRVRGRVFLWETLFRDIPKHRKASNGLPDRFSPRTIYFVVNNVFREYSDAHPDQLRLTPHALRRRAITRVVMATQNVDVTAQAIGLHPQTARTYYLDAKEAFDTDAVFKAVAETLLPDSGKIEGESRTAGKKTPKFKGYS